MDVGTINRSQKRNGNLYLVLIIIALFFLNFYSKTLFYRPGSIHQWRQTDCLSIAKNYYEEGMNFFTPKLHYQGVKDGKAVSEFPILNYSAAALWKIFGEHEYIYRFLEYFIFLCSIFVLFNTLLVFFRSILLALFAVSILLTSPLLTYYGVSFIADVPAFSLGVICFCLTFRFYETGKMSNFYMALFTGTLAVLIKASAMVGLSLLLFISVVDLLGLNRHLGLRSLFSKKMLPALLILVSAGLVIAWYRFALFYNNNNNNNIFLLTVLPIWEMDEKELIHNLKILFNSLFPIFLNRPVFFLVMAFAVYVMANFKKLSNFLKYAFIFSALFFISYLLFFFQVFGVHDYYLINIMIFPVVIIISFISLIHTSQFYVENTRFIRAFLFASLLFNSLHCAAIYRLRTVEDDKMVYWFPFISEEEKNLAKYYFWDYGNSIKHLEHFEPVLRNAGIKRTDNVLSIPDHSFDISLYLMDQKGFTVARDHIMNDSTVMDRFMPKVKYVILSDTTLQKTTAFKRMLPQMQLYFTNQAVAVYKVNPGS